MKTSSRQHTSNLRPGFWCVLAFLWCLQGAKAQTQVLVYPGTISGSPIANNSVFTVTDPLYGASGWEATHNIDFTLSVENRIILEVDESAYVDKTSGFTVDVPIFIEYWAANTITSDPASFSENITLSIKDWQHDTELSTPHKAYHFKQWKINQSISQRYHKMRITVGTLVFGTGATNPPLVLKGEIIVQRKHTFNLSTAPTINTLADPTPIDYGELSWSSYTGADEYDLEWVFYDDRSVIGTKINNSVALTTDEVKSLFKNNATRVSITGTDFNIPLLYPKGFLFYRLRAVRYDQNDVRRYTPWTTQGTSAKFELEGHEDLNWQAQTTFAEEGKHVPSLQYLDGTLRARQTLTLSNSINSTLGSSTIYDHQGRPGVQTLTAPTFSNLFRYDAHFAAKNVSGVLYPYTKADFDLGDCSALPEEMGSTSSGGGAERFFSDKNPYQADADETDKNLPKAHGYAFSLTEYTQDRTGRIRRQRMPGYMFHALNNPDYSTRYFYGKPSQNELDRLFGNDVGTASHYQKNMVIDGNNQASVAYIDMHGRTVATALAGLSPGTLDSSLVASTVGNFKQDLLNNIIRENQRISSGTLLAAKSGVYSLKYILESTAFSDTCAPEACYDCRYDISLKITNECGDTIYSATTLKNYTPEDSLDQDCLTIPELYNIDTSASLNLDAGEYIVSKIITLNQDAVNQNLELFLSQATCVPSLEELQNQYLENIDLSACLATCETCEGELDSLLVLKNNGFITQAEYDLAQRECAELCAAGPSTCEALKKMLEADVSPGGQYALFSIDSTGALVVPDTASIFYLSKYSVLSNPSEDYLNHLGQPDTILIDGVKKTPKELTPIEFLTYWKSSWAWPLAQNYHPEYCYYTWCAAQDSANHFEAELLATETYSEAETEGWMSDTTLNILDLDPFFNGGEGDSCKAQLQTQLDTFGGAGISLEKFASNQVFGEACNTIIGDSGTSPADNDAAWRIIRSIYFGLASNCKNQARAEADNCNSTIVDCIGDTTCTNVNYKYKVRRAANNTIPADFPAPLTESDLNDLQSEGSAALIEACEQGCIDNVEQWLIELDTICALSPSEINDLRPRLLAVCQMACDDSHPYGATSVPPGRKTATYDDVSFEQILNDYLDTARHGVCKPCFAGIITSPGSYLVQAYSGARTVDNRDNTCACGNLSKLEAQYDEEPAGASSFVEYLQKFSLVAMDTNDINVLIEACTSTVRSLASPVTLPPYLECGVCKTCAEVEALAAEYSASPNSCSTSVPEYYDYLARYLNYRLGWSLSADAYQNFLDGCDSSPMEDELPIAHRLLCPSEPFLSIPFPDDCAQSLQAQALQQAEIAYRAQLDSVKGRFLQQYFEHCLRAISDEQLYVTSDFKEYQYTLYYYDQSGQLTQTIPPAGVTLLSDAQVADVQTARQTGMSPVYPAHTLPTRYAYTSLNGQISHTSPDALEIHNWYDEVGRLVVSQDGRQRELSPKRFSYTLYDELGRVVEVGEIRPVDTTTAYVFRIKSSPVNQTDVSALLSGGTRSQVTHTYYDDSPVSAPDGLSQQNLRSRVAMHSIEATYDGDDSTYDYATHYDYDLTGDVSTLLQEISALQSVGHRYKRINYDYDQLSGKVNYVHYQRGRADQYSLHYRYDLDNRLTEVYSSFIDSLYPSSGKLLWDQHAAYTYYRHGPLARTELGHYRVQGLDYAYTLQGWIKSMNASFLDPEHDMGRDGQINASSTNQLVSRDVFGYTLGFYHYGFIGDYQPINSNYSVEPDRSAGSSFNTYSRSMFNGNIRYIMQQNEGSSSGAYIHGYRYDQTMRLKAMNTYVPGAGALSAWEIDGTNPAPLATNYKEGNITYDRNGNIQNYQRWGSSSSVQDDLTYNYLAGTNKLEYVADAVSSGGFSTDFDGQSSGNYTYDGAGNLKGDAQSFISSGDIRWSPYGKVLEVNVLGGLAQNIFGYDAMQNRVLKRKVTFLADTSTYYIRDAQGNVMAVYGKKGSTVTWLEQHLYGSSRLGTVVPGVKWTSTPVASPYFRDTTKLKLGWYRYEITDHLGNVRDVINDRRTIVNAGNSSTRHYTATILNGTDYFPFGAEMRGSVVSSSQKYRYGFNGKELDKDFEFGSLNHYDYGFRIYNPGIGRFLSVDPLTSNYPFFTPYQFAGNAPIAFVDMDGQESEYFMNENQRVAEMYGLTANQMVIRPGIQNFMLKGYKLLWPKSYAGYIRSELESKNINVSELSDTDLNKYYRIRKAGDDFEVSPKASLGGKLMETAIDLLDIAALFPGKGGVFLPAKLPSGLITKQISAASSFLSQQAILHRLGKDPIYRNIAMATYESENGIEVFTLVTSTGRSGITGKYPPHTHAEIVLLGEMQRQGIDLSKVKKIFSELQPCTKCEDKLYDQLPKNVKVEYLYKLDADGFAPPEFKKYIEKLAKQKK